MKRRHRKTHRLMNIGLYIQLLYLIQVLLLIVTLVYRIFSSYTFIKLNWKIDIDKVLLFLAFLMLINGYLVIKDVVDIKKWKERIRMKDEAYDYIKKLNQDLRMQRHDFLNHIQVIYSLNELEEYEECKAYLNRIYEHIGRLSENIKTDKIAINALLQAKANEAQGLGIEYQVKIRSKLSELVIPDWEMCRCLGNLIDNAFTATLQYNSSSIVYIEIEENITHYFLAIRNTGYPIPEKIAHSIFESGFTTKTKEAEDHGMGLFIVRKILNQYGSAVTMDYAKPHISFVMEVPKTDIMSKDMYNSDRIS